MILQLPIKRGVTIDSAHDIIWINNLEDFKRCITQYFAENMLDWYKVNFKMDGHNGVDINLLRGEEIYASHDGRVTEISDDESAGIGVVVWDYNNLYKTIYWHLKIDSVVVKLGQEVKTGDLLGLGNSTGWSTGDHLHWGLKKTNEQGTTINKDNGFWGAIDPMPFLDNIGEQEMKLIIKDGEQYLRDANGLDHHIVNVYSLNKFVESGLIESLVPEQVDTVNKSGFEWAVLPQNDIK